MKKSNTLDDPIYHPRTDDPLQYSSTFDFQSLNYPLEYDKTNPTFLDSELTKIKEEVKRSNIRNKLSKLQNRDTFLSLNKDKISKNQEKFIKDSETNLKKYYSDRYEYPNTDIAETIIKMSEYDDYGNDISKPFLLLTLGPTGVGKSNFKRKMIDEKLPEMNFVEISIDEDVENEEQYKEDVISILYETNIWNVKNDTFYDKKSIEDPKVVEQFNVAYKKSKDRQRGKRDYKINKAIQNKENVIIETTGKDIPNTYIDRFKDYNIIFIYIIIPNTEIKDSVWLRFTTSTYSFMKDTDNKPAPRLPDTGLKNIVELCQEIIRIAYYLRRICLNRLKTIDDYSGDIRNFERTRDDYITLDKFNRKKDNKLKIKCGSINDDKRFGLIVYNNDKKLNYPKAIYNHMDNSHINDKYFRYIMERALFPDKKDLQIFGEKKGIAGSFPQSDDPYPYTDTYNSTIQYDINNDISYNDNCESGVDFKNTTTSPLKSPLASNYTSTRFNNYYGTLPNVRDKDKLFWYENEDDFRFFPEQGTPIPQTIFNDDSIVTTPKKLKKTKKRNKGGKRKNTRKYKVKK